MTKEAVLELLRTSDGFVSGQDMSGRLQLTRAAVWKAVQALREEGWEIESVPRRGYRLTGRPDRLNAGEILRELGAEPLVFPIIRDHKAMLEDGENQRAEAFFQALERGARDGGDG